MKVFFTTSQEEKDKYQPAHTAIIETLRKLDIDINSLEVEKYTDLLDKKLLRGKSESEIQYLYSKKAISIANAVIIDASVNNFNLGHDATLALLYNKPVLCISNTQDYAKEIIHPKFYARIYRNVNDIEDIIVDFINDIKSKHFSVRFNGFMSPEQKNFLEWYGVKVKKNVSEVIRDLIDQKMMENSDYFEGVN